MPCAIGRGGIGAQKREGDGVTPAGVWRIVGGGWRADRRRAPGMAGLVALGPGHRWSDDPRDPAYNRLLVARAHPFGHERLRRGDRLYDVVLFSDWNWPDAVAGRGSAIFLHHWRRARFPTAGCIAFAPRDLDWIMARWTPRARVFVGWPYSG